ncbi:MAG: hypothetical protein ACJ8H8_10790 [Geminicoccaceae bacterium]
MLYPWLEWQRRSVEALLLLTRFLSVASPLGSTLLHLPCELLARTLAAGAVRDRPVEAVVRRDVPFPVQDDLAVAALLAAQSAYLAPLSLVFLGCQLDLRVSPTPLQSLLAQWPRELLRACLTVNVAAD